MQASTLVQRNTGAHDTPKGRPERNFYIVTFGVVLPVISLLIEAFSHWSRQIYFDPFGHPLHIACLVAVPLANLIGAMSNQYRSSRFLFWASNLNSAALVTGFVYALIYLPILPFGAFAILLAGIGFLPLTPLLAWIASLVVRRRLHRLLEDREPRSGWIVHLGFIAATSALLLPLIPRALTCYAAQCALGKPGASQRWGMSWLRAPADLGFLQERALGGRGLNYSSWLILSPQQAGQALFIASGKTVETFAGNSPGQRFREDRSRGSQMVGEIIPEVEMALSALNSSVDAEAGVAYTEWTFAFTNSAMVQHEARMEVELPKDAVVSRLTLWINGEPREAAFGTRAQTTAAYRNVVVVERRDPVLVTTSGPDRILIQCFPVPPGGSAMQARVGISSPLKLDAHGKGELTFPRILSRNFTLADDHLSQCWIESRSPMIGLGLTKWAAPEPGTYALKGESATGRLGEANMRTLNPVGISYCPRPEEAGGGYVVQKPASLPRWAPAKLAIVLDSSAGMESARDDLVQALTALPNCEMTLLVANDDDPLPLVPGHLRRLTAEEKANLTSALQAVRFSGGKSNAPALLKAWNLVSGSPRGAILWLHGQEPDLGIPFALRNNFERHPGSPKLFSLQSVPGPNHLAAQLSAFPAFEQMRWSPGEARRLFTKWSEHFEEKQLVREQVKELPAGAKETSPHLLRLWAKKEVDRQIERGQVQSATTLALASKIVTPVTGAVVLENQSQYQAAGLKPEDGSKVPTIPEPAETMLGIITLAFLIGRRWRRGTILAQGNA